MGFTGLAGGMGARLCASFRFHVRSGGGHRPTWISGPHTDYLPSMFMCSQPTDLVRVSCVSCGAVGKKQGERENESESQTGSWQHNIMSVGRGRESEESSRSGVGASGTVVLVRLEGLN